MQKLEAYAKTDEGKKKIEETVRSIRRGEGRSGRTGRTEAGDVVVTYPQMEAAARELIALIRQRAASVDLPASVMAHIESFEASPLVEHDDGSASIEIKMLDNPHRDSIQPLIYPRGADNIVALFNSGYSADGAVYGPWESAGLNVWTRKSRRGLYFLQDAISAFNSMYGEKYNVTVTLDAVYDKRY